MPFFKLHSSEVYENAKRRGIDKYGPLLDTCTEGSKCREEKRIIMIKNLKVEWKKTIDQFRTLVEGSLDYSEDEIFRIYGDMV